MKPGHIAAWVITATALPVLAACSGGSSSGNAPAGGTATGGNQPATSAPAQSQPAQSQSAAAATGADGLTPPGTHLAFGKNAIVGWVPQSQDGTGAHKGIKMQVAVESIQKGTLRDFANVNLDAKEKKDTPYYVTLRLTELQNAAVPQDSDPAITFTAIDDRGQAQESITVLGTFQRCDEVSAPKALVSGKSYSTCMTYLIPGGGSIQSVKWDSGPSPANDVSPYFDKPIVWGV
jgi:hypothetical protein